MFCANCGAAVSGNYCSVCGRKIRSALEEFRLAERKAAKELQKHAGVKCKRAVNDGYGCIGRLMDACVMAARNSYRRLDDSIYWTRYGDPAEFEELMLEKLEASNTRAKKLFDFVSPFFEEALDAGVTPGELQGAAEMELH